MKIKNEHLILNDLIKTIRTLRGPNGCPWDQEQTNKSLSKYLKEESQEVLEAIAEENKQGMCEELGDLLFIIIMYCEINGELENFTISEMLDMINKKLIRRHPHVFAGKPYKDKESLRKQWQEIKAIEKRK